MTENLPEGEEKMTGEYLDTEESDVEAADEEDIEMAASEEELEMGDYEKEMTAEKAKTSHTHEGQLEDEAGLVVI